MAGEPEHRLEVGVGDRRARQAERVDRVRAGARGQQLRENAEQCLVSMSEFVCRASLGKRIIPRTDYQMLNELRRQGGNLRNLLSEKIDGARDKEIALAAIEALRDIVRVIDKAIDFEGDEQ